MTLSIETNVSRFSSVFVVPDLARKKVDLTCLRHLSDADDSDIFNHSTVCCVDNVAPVFVTAERIRTSKQQRMIIIVAAEREQFNCHE